MAKGRSVRLYLVDGTATGILTAEIMNWTGHVLAAPRTRIEDALSRSELRRTGVYFLFGPDEEVSDVNRVYVGEGDEIAKRIYQHNKEKVFWERFIAVTSKDMNLTKAHVRYLEGRLLQLVQEAKKAKLANKDLPQFDLLPEADKADMEAFLEEIQLVLPVIGADFLRRPTVNVKPKSISDSAPASLESQNQEGNEHVLFVLSNSNAGIEATAREISGEFVVLSGSRGSLKEKSSFHDRIKAIRDEALETGRARKINDRNFVLDEDISFSSPSAASVFLFGTSRNGRADWIVSGNNKNYGTWKEEVIDERAKHMVLQL
ncbi:GIY-YIG nuclease family protein [Palleronia sp. KMU-117]|uniref:GIY-YIG nuclease family protein n=1 Tax=Palleronia sp. KMU-117 TaxID=3434108 RepID=UPI003D73D402